MFSEAAAEILFTDNCCDNRSIAQIILDIIIKVYNIFFIEFFLIIKIFIKSPIDMRRIFLSNLLVVGGLARMKGFLSRLKYELLRLIHDPKEEYYFRLNGLNEVAFYLFENNVNLELYCAWLGGQLYFFFLNNL